MPYLRGRYGRQRVKIVAYLFQRKQFVSRETFTMYGVLIQLSLTKSYFCASFLALVTESNLHIYKYKDLDRR